MSGWCIRVNDYPVEGTMVLSYAKRIEELVKVEDYKSVLAIKHKGEKSSNPHFHIVIGTQVKDQAIRVRLRKVFPEGKGNQHMSIKRWDGNEDALSYLFHEGGDPFVVKGWEQGDLERFKNRNVQVKEAVEKAKGKASYLLEDEVYNVLSKMREPPRDDITIAKAIVRAALSSGKYIPNDFLLRSIVSRIQYRLCGGDLNEEDAFIDMYVRKALKINNS